MLEHSYLYNAAFIDDLYETYLTNPTQISGEWRDYFVQLQQELPQSKPDIPHAPIRATFTDFKPKHSKHNGAELEALATVSKKQALVLRLINAHRFRGHQQADLDPLKLQERPDIDELHPEFYGFAPADMGTVFNTGSLHGVDDLKLADILKRVKKIYCGTIGAEYMHITETKQKRWIQKRLEGTLAAPNFLISTKLNILERLTAAQGLEEFLHTQYVGQKRFSLEGGDSLIPLLDDLISHASVQGVKEIVLGMAHRGRLNVLVNIMGKRPKDLFSEFEGKAHQQVGSGDVKYHQGFSTEVITEAGPMHIALAFNPSHLEIICPVVEGAVRARQEQRHDKQRNEVLPILIHGDAAFAGQGVIMETLSLSQTRGYGTGGTVHIVINNQIGFTTSDPLDTRSTFYCTDVAKMVQAPIFHVNGDDPEAVLYVTKLALDFRMEFHKEVVIDMVCYRRQGHNESDDPVPTQPVMYQKIAKQSATRAIYAQRLINDGIIRPEEAELMLHQYKAALKTKERVAPHATGEKFFKGVVWQPYLGTHWTTPADTRITQDTLQDFIKRFTTLPEGFKLTRSVAKVVEERQKMGRGELSLDWGCAETLAYATLLEAGYPVRLSGQDSGRGTFAHRHAVWHHEETDETYLPLQHLSKQQARFLVINSLLSEEAVLAFEYGYSASEPETLDIWEAQFGDFANGAQVVIDQFISSSEAKWQRYCGLVMLLPHGYDGQGPEHSSARLERYLQLCAEDNIQVCVPSTPAQFFHLLRRQMLRPYRKPLIIMTPKSLLRHKRSVSSFADFTQHGFQTIIDEVNADIQPDKVERILYCTGKVYYDLVDAREKHGIDNIAIIRLEQIYPYPREAVTKILERYPHVRHRVWVQEEPRNQGAWWYMRAHMDVNLSHKDVGRLEYAGRPSSASPAAGSYQLHRTQLEAFLAEALQLKK
jgi:2-oxoglutarate dehydrogenase E1 component